MCVDRQGKDRQGKKAMGAVGITGASAHDRQCAYPSSSQLCMCFFWGGAGVWCARAEQGCLFAGWARVHRKLCFRGAAVYWCVSFWGRAARVLRAGGFAANCSVLGLTGWLVLRAGVLACLRAGVWLLAVLPCDCESLQQRKAVFKALLCLFTA